MASYFSLFSPKRTKLSLLAMAWMLPFGLQAAPAEAEPQAMTSQVSDVAQTAEKQDFVGDGNISYGPITKVDTLWKIAVSHRPDNSVTNYQVMMAIFKHNPNAFLNNDVNNLVAGHFLRIPTLEQIKIAVPNMYPPQNKQAQNTASESSPQISAESVAKKSVAAESVTEESVETASEIAPVAKASEPFAAEQSIDPALVEVTKVALTPAANNKTTDIVPEGLQSEIPPVVLESPVDEPVESQSAALPSDNEEIKESLISVDNQLASLQYEVAKTTEKQQQIDQVLAEQQRLLALIKEREQDLLKHQQALSKNNQSLFNNPTSYWSTMAVLAVMICILFVIVNRRRKPDINLNEVKPVFVEKPEAKSNSKGKNVKDANDTKATDTKATDTKATVAKVTEIIEDTSFLVEPKDVKEQPLAKPTAESADVSKPTEKVVAKAEPVIEPPVKSTTPSQQETAFSSLDLVDEKELLSENEITEEDLLSFVNESNRLSADAKMDDAESVAPQTPSSTTLQEDSSLDIDQIIDGMLENENKPAQLRSSKTGNEKATVNLDNDEGKILDKNESKPVNEIEDYDDVEFDKLLAEISAQTDDFGKQSNVISINSGLENKATSGNAGSKNSEQFISVDELIADGDDVVEVEDRYYEKSIDVGLEEFPEFQTGVNHVNVDDDKHGVNAKLDLAQVYIEIGDTDNAAVILKNVMKLGNSGQQQKAQQLLYSLK